MRIRKARNTTLDPTTKAVSFGDERRCMKISATITALAVAMASASGVFQIPRCWYAAQSVRPVRTMSAVKTTK